MGRMNGLSGIKLSAILVVAYIVIINLITFVVYGRDKSQARRREWRTPESTLFILAIAGGSVGALAGMYLFHHKTRKKSFMFGIPIILLVQLLLILLLVVTTSDIVFL